MKKRNVKQLVGMSSKKKKWIIVGAIVVVIVVGAISVSGRKQTDSLPQVTVEQAKKTGCHFKGGDKWNGRKPESEDLFFTGQCDNFQSWLSNR